LREGEFKMAVANIVMTNIICIFFVFAGFTAARWLLQSMK
jgi:fluoride ion exporter CrcB/FEX